MANDSENKDVLSSITSIFGGLDALLRAVVPGFIVILIVFVFIPSNRQIYEWFNKDDYWRGVGIASLLGIISYSLHTTVLEDIVMLFPLYVVRNFLEEEPSTKELGYWQLIHVLSRDR